VQRIVGISGKIGSGKDTLADLIVKNNYNFKKKSFAFKLKIIGMTLTGAHPESSDWFTQEGKNVYLSDWNMTIGEFQQKLGTEAIRTGLHTNAWVISLFADLDPDCKWLITDMRFKNEAQAVKEKGGVLVRINGDPAKTRANSKRNLNHPSETDLDDFKDWDMVINNNGTIEQLEVYAKSILARWS
jgi:hypothetical protein